jgi:hypothetical protein
MRHSFGDWTQFAFGVALCAVCGVEGSYYILAGIVAGDWHEMAVAAVLMMGIGLMVRGLNGPARRARQAGGGCVAELFSNCTTTHPPGRLHSPVPSALPRGCRSSGGRRRGRHPDRGDGRRAEADRKGKN